MRPGIDGSQFGSITTMEESIRDFARASLIRCLPSGKSQGRFG